VGPFRGEEGIVIDVEKQISEKFGEKAGKQAGEMARAFMEKLTQEWHQKHGPIDKGDGLSIGRLKELVGNIKQKVEGMEEEKDDWHPSKHVTDPQKKKELAPYDKHVDRGDYAARAAYLDAAGVKRDQEQHEEGVDPVNVPAYIRKQKQPGQDAAQKSIDQKNKDSGAKVWSSPRLPKESVELESIIKLAGLAK
jgi:hypothetical protein